MGRAVDPNARGTPDDDRIPKTNSGGVMAEGTKVRVDLGDGTIVRLRARNHVWNADEPIAQRGTDQGPNPYELLLGSLGACTALTLRLYAHHKQIALKTIRLEYEFTREYGRDCRECETDDDAKLDVIRCRAVVETILSSKSKKAGGTYYPAITSTT
jgi:uncharacterized OsmC-like protein